MRENEMDNITFGPDEKEILNILGSFENNLGDKYKDTNTQIKYYNNFKFNGESIDGLENIFIVAEKDEDGKIIGYDIYTPDMRKIFSTDSKGDITESIEGLEQTLGKLNIKDLIEENNVIDIDENGKEQSRLKGISEKAEPEELQRAIENEDEHGNKQKEVEEEKQEGNENENEQNEETQEIEQDLEEQGEDLQISNYRKIKDNYISERMSEVFQEGTEHGIAFSNKYNRFVIISKVNGHYQLNKNVEPARMTWKSIISVAPDGEKVERKVPHALMKTNRDEKEIAVMIGAYGQIDIETVDVLPCQERVAREVRTDGEGSNKEESFKVREDFKTEGKEYKHDIAHKVQDIEQAQREANKTVDYNITPDDIIPNTEMTWGELMENTGESLPKLIERYDREIGRNKTPEKAVADIEDDYSNIQHEHNR